MCLCDVHIDRRSVVLWSIYPCLSIGGKISKQCVLRIRVSWSPAIHDMWIFHWFGLCSHHNLRGQNTQHRFLAPASKGLHASFLHHALSLGKHGKECNVIKQGCRVKVYQVLTHIAPIYLKRSLLYLMLWSKWSMGVLVSYLPWVLCIGKLWYAHPLPLEQSWRQLFSCGSSK